MKVTHIPPPTSGHVIRIDTDQDDYLCSATAQKDGTWKVSVSDELRKRSPFVNQVSYASISLTGSIPEVIEATLSLIATGIAAELYPQPGRPDLQRGMDRIITVVKDVCSPQQLDIIYSALGKPVEDPAEL